MKRLIIGMIALLIATVCCVGCTSADDETSKEKVIILAVPD